MPADPRLCAIIDPARAGGHNVAELARRVAAGGATMVQLRDKQHETRTMVDEAQAIKAALAPFRVPLVINDRVDVALAVGADGVHVGQDDLTPQDARRLLGPHAIIGLSIKSVTEAEAAPVEVIDYAGVGGIYLTLSKAKTSPPIGPDGFARVAGMLRRRAPNLPVCGIAGIDESNAAAVVTAGADGVAVISALSQALDPEAAARHLREIVDAILAKRGT